MRAALAASLLLLLAVPAASAQMADMLDLQVKAPTDPVGVDGAKVTVTVALICPNQAMVMPDQVVALTIDGVQGSVIDGPESIIFPSRLCAQQAIDERTAEFTVKLPPDAPGSMVYKYHVQAEPRSNGYAIFGQPNGEDASFHLVAPPAPEPETPLETLANETISDEVAQAAETAAQDGQVMDVPAPSWLLAVLGIGLAALRRR